MIHIKNKVKRIYSDYFSQGNIKPLKIKNNGYIFVLDGLKAILIDIFNSYSYYWI